MLIFRNNNEILCRTFNNSNNKACPDEGKILNSDGLPVAMDFPPISSSDTLRCSQTLPEQWQSLTPWAEVGPEFIPAMHVASCDTSLYDDCDWLGLREVWSMFGDEAFAKVGAAWQYMNWFRSVRLCSSCGAELVPNENDFGRKCPKCGKVFYAPQSPAVIMSITREFETSGGKTIKKLLLAHNKSMAGNRVSVLAGFVEPGETLEQTVAREVREEVGIEVQDIKYFGSQSWPFPHSLMLGFTTRWLSGELHPDMIEIGSAGWYSPEEVAALDLPNGASISRRLINNFVAMNS